MLVPLPKAAKTACLVYGVSRAWMSPFLASSHPAMSSHVRADWVLKAYLDCFSIFLRMTWLPALSTTESPTSTGPLVRDTVTVPDAMSTCMTPPTVWATVPAPPNGWCSEKRTMAPVVGCTSALSPGSGSRGRVLCSGRSCSRTCPFVSMT